eukprot:1128199-Prymnesium_polylepis.1
MPHATRHVHVTCHMHTPRAHAHAQDRNRRGGAHGTRDARTRGDWKVSAHRTRWSCILRGAARRAWCACAACVWRACAWRVCVLTGYKDAAHEHDTCARRANDASGVPRRGPPQRSSTKPAPARPAGPCVWR